MAIKELASNGHLPVAGKVGIVVDAYLGDIPEINARNQAIIENLALPKNFTLIYDVFVHQLVALSPVSFR